MNEDNLSENKLVEDEFVLTTLGKKISKLCYKLILKYFRNNINQFINKENLTNEIIEDIKTSIKEFLYTNEQLKNELNQITNLNLTENEFTVLIDDFFDTNYHYIQNYLYSKDTSINQKLIDELYHWIIKHIHLLLRKMNIQKGEEFYSDTLQDYLLENKPIEFIEIQNWEDLVNECFDKYTYQLFDKVLTYIVNMNKTFRDETIDSLTKKNDKINSESILPFNPTSQIYRTAPIIVLYDKKPYVFIGITKENHIDFYNSDRFQKQIDKFHIKKKLYFEDEDMSFAFLSGKIAFIFGEDDLNNTQLIQVLKQDPRIEKVYFCEEGFDNKVRRLAKKL